MIYLVPALITMAGAYSEANSQPMVSYRNLLTVGTIASGTLPTVNPRNNAATEDTASFWGPTGASTLTVTLGAAEPADLCMIAAHDLFTQGESLTLEYYNGAAWVELAEITPTSNHPFMILFPRVSAAQWRVSVSGACSIGVVWIGPRMIIPGGIVPGYAEVWASRSITKLGGGSRRGHWLGQRVESVTAELSAEFMPVPYGFALNDLAVFREHYNEGRAFVWASAPDVFRQDCAYAWAVDGAVFQPVALAGGELCNLSMSMVAYCEP